MSESIVVVCPMCKGWPGEWPYSCWNCVPSRHVKNHPGPGFVLRAQTSSDFAIGDIVVDAWTGERYELRQGKAGRLLFRSQDRGFEYEEYSPANRYLSLERAALPETWVKPEVGPEPEGHPFRRDGVIRAEATRPVAAARGSLQGSLRLFE